MASISFPQDAGPKFSPRFPEGRDEGEEGRKVSGMVEWMIGFIRFIGTGNG